MLIEGWILVGIGILLTVGCIVVAGSKPFYGLALALPTGIILAIAIVMLGATYIVTDSERRGECDANRQMSNIELASGVMKIRESDSVPQALQALQDEQDNDNWETYLGCLLEGTHNPRGISAQIDRVSDHVLNQARDITGEESSRSMDNSDRIRFASVIRALLGGET